MGISSLGITSGDAREDDTSLRLTGKVGFRSPVAHRKGTERREAEKIVHATKAVMSGKGRVKERAKGEEKGEGKRGEKWRGQEGRRRERARGEVKGEGKRVE